MTARQAAAEHDPGADARADLQGGEVGDAAGLAEPPLPDGESAASCSTSTPCPVRSATSAASRVSTSPGTGVQATTRPVAGSQAAGTATPIPCSSPR